MSFSTDLVYLRMLNMEGYEEKRNGNAVANFRCPVCGDSDKDKRKKRGWALHKTGTNYIGIYCHNCGYSSTLDKLIANYFGYLYKEYKLAKLKDAGVFTKAAEPEKAFSNYAPKTKIPDIALPTIKSLDDDRLAKRYVLDRKIPECMHSDIYYTNNFYEWAKGKFDSIDEEKRYAEEARIVFPLRSSNGNLMGVNARLLKGNGAKYITLLANQEFPKIYGLDRINKNRPVYVVEGPIDSLHLPNCVAVVGGVASLQKYENVLGKNIVVVADNEKRNVHTVRNMLKAAKLGYSVFVPRRSWKYKDLNEAVCDGLSEEKLLDVVRQSTYNGTEARVRIGCWRKI